MARAWIFPDNVDTDVLAPGRYMKSGIEEMARHCMEVLDPEFARGVRPGDVVIAGRNFGMGSSREQAPQALKHLGVAAVIAPSFGGIFYRNALNLGLIALECKDAGRIQAGDEIEFDPEAGRIVDRTTAQVLACAPIPQHLMAMVRAGGLLPFLEERLAGQRKPVAGPRQE
jgi:3-isopropylmalate/(R)-2-methylmalate dehydratase small subunit